jgi:cytochrome d ubiquinol oxidase subunit I
VLALGTCSGFFIVATNAWMQHPVGFTTGADGRLHLESLSALLLNPWLWWQFPHTILGAITTGAVVVTGVGAWYLLAGRHEDQGRRFVRVGVLVGLPAVLLLAFPTGDAQAKLVQAHQPEAFAAMEGLFDSEHGAGLVLIGQPDMEALRLDNPVAVPKVLSFMTHGRWNAEVKGLKDLPRDRWPDNIPLLYYAYHVMVGIGTILLAAFGLAALWLWRGRLYASRPLLWTLLLAVPLPYIANTTGWMTAELGRQPWVVHGILRTKDAWSANVSAGNALFTLIGFAGLYVLLSVLYVLLVGRKLVAGPDPAPPAPGAPAPAAAHPEA